LRSDPIHLWLCDDATAREALLELAEDSGLAA
jgi:hypothetical protein